MKAGEAVMKDLGSLKMPKIVIGSDKSPSCKEDITGEALSTLVINKLRGVLQIAAVKAPGYGDRRKAMLQDIAVLTGGEAVMKDLGMKAEEVEVARLGRAKKIVIGSDKCTIVAPPRLLPPIPITTREAAERLAKLAGGVAQIHVGAGSKQN